MIYVTGDTHGDLERFQSGEIRRLKKGDTLIVLGDFGFVWDASKQEQKTLQWLGKRKYKVLFLDGTHENYTLLNQYPVEEFAGGKVRRISGNLMQLMRGEIYELEGKSVFVFGGGESLDREMREENHTWWSEELPTSEQIRQAAERLKKRDMQVDYILTHDAPGRIRSFIDMDDMNCNHLHAFLDELLRNCKYKKWFFGYYHLDKTITPTQYAVFKRILPVETVQNKKKK